MANIKRINLPMDQNNNPVQLTPAVPALEETYDPTISASAALTFNAASTFIEVTAIDEGIFLSWGAAAATNASFDEYIAKDTTRQFYIPVDTSTDKLFTKANFIERAATALLVVIEK